MSSPFRLFLGVFGVFALLAVALPLRAIPGYGPFYPQDRITSLLLIPGVEAVGASVPGASTTWRLPFAPQRWATLRLEPAANGTPATLVFHEGTADASERFALSPPGLAREIGGAYVACLNADDQPDVVLTVTYFGNGLAADLVQVVFLLSTPAGRYELTAHDSYDWESSDLLNIKGDGQVHWVQTTLEQTEDARGRSQSYWVHTLWRISGSELVRDRELARKRYWSDPTKH